MLEWVTGETIFAELVLHRGSDDRTLLLLEGDSDCRSLDSHIDESLCLSIPCHGKENLLPAMELVEEHGVSDVIALCDRDWDGYLPTPAVPGRVAITDYYDLDASIILSSGTCARVVKGQANRRELSHHLFVSKSTGPKAIAVAYAGPVGLLRLESERRGYGLALRDFPMSPVTKSDYTGVDIEKLVDIAARRSMYVEADSETLLGQLRDSLSEAHSLEPFCSGHDLLAALSLVLRKRWGKTVSPENLGDTFRGALACENLRKMTFYGLLMGWSSKGSIWHCENGHRNDASA